MDVSIQRRTFLAQKAFGPETHVIGEDVRDSQRHTSFTKTHVLHKDIRVSQRRTSFSNTYVFHKDVGA